MLALHVCHAVADTPCSAAVDPDGGVMYVYGGVVVRELDGSRAPADTEPGLVHAFEFATYTWKKISTKGERVGLCEVVRMWVCGWRCVLVQGLMLLRCAARRACLYQLHRGTSATPLTAHASISGTVGPQCSATLPFPFICTATHPQ